MKKIKFGNHFYLDASRDSGENGGKKHII